ncbi:unnamed protein product, partial [Amoebophrya sp. A25]|eukprot:GSA25T00008673001.1
MPFAAEAAAPAWVSVAVACGFFERFAHDSSPVPEVLHASRSMWTRVPSGQYSLGLRTLKALGENTYEQAYAERTRVTVYNPCPELCNLRCQECGLRVTRKGVLEKGPRRCIEATGISYHVGFR